MNERHLSYVSLALSGASLLIAVFFFGRLTPGFGLGNFGVSKMMTDSTGSNQSIPLVTEGGALAAIAVDNGVKVISLSADFIRWEITPDVVVDAWGYNGQVPGPEIRVTEGDRVRIVFKNNLPEATTLHWHGIDVPNDQDGIPGVTQEPIDPGETYTYEFTAKPSGTMWYHSHQNSIKQLDMGLSGAFIIEAKDEPKYDQDVTILLDEWMVGENGVNMANSVMHAGHDLSLYNYFTMNGKSFPATRNVSMEQGKMVRVRFINAGYQNHPMHLHGKRFKVIATDGAELPEPIEKDTLNIAPGERYDIIISTDELGDWMLHCHQLHHVANDGQEPGGLMMMFRVKKEI